jgi:hypothetical protein
MALDFRYFDPAVPADATDVDDVDVDPHWAENIVTAVATSLAVLVVAAIAVLIGMA